MDDTSGATRRPDSGTPGAEGWRPRPGTDRPKPLAAQIARVLPITARVPLRQRPDQTILATVPFLTIPVVDWSRATRGDRLAELLELVQDRGGLWLSRNTTATVEQHTPPILDPSVRNRDQKPNDGISINVRFEGVWRGQFLIIADGAVASELSRMNLSPLIAFVPDEVADNLLHSFDRPSGISWLQLSKALDNAVHARAY